MSKRNRPGKRQREQATQRAFARYVAIQATNNEREGLSKPKRIYGAPRDLSSSTASRDTLKLGSYGNGFRGPRGFASPKYLVGKQEADGAALAPRDDLRVTGEASKRFARDGHADDNGAAMRSQRIERKEAKARRFKALLGTEPRVKPAAQARWRNGNKNKN